jgi:hypothetical protein
MFIFLDGLVVLWKQRVSIDQKGDMHPMVAIKPAGYGHKVECMLSYQAFQALLLQDRDT